jgi:hypothetical protein
MAKGLEVALDTAGFPKIAIVLTAADLALVRALRPRGTAVGEYLLTAFRRRVRWWARRRWGWRWGNPKVELLYECFGKHLRFTRRTRCPTRARRVAERHWLVRTRFWSNRSDQVRHPASVIPENLRSLARPSGWVPSAESGRYTSQ